MPLISIEEVQGNRPFQLARAATINKSASSVLREKSARFSATDRFDIFLSHSYSDAKLILDLKVFLEKFDLSVYVDWDTDAQLDRTRVNRHTADTLRTRMQQCRGLLYATSDNSRASVWMPWELGYFDARNGRCAILPLMAGKQYGEEYTGQEYLGLYPYVIRAHTRGGIDTLWVQTSATNYVSIQNWLKGQNPQIHK